MRQKPPSPFFQRAEHRLEALARLFVRRGFPQGIKVDVRLSLGRWLAPGLEFALAADILRTAVAPAWRDIGQLAAIAVLGTGMNH